MLKNLPIRLKMVAIYVNMVIFTIPLLIACFLCMNWLNNSLNTLHYRDMKSVEHALKMEAALQEQRVNYRDVLLANGADELQDAVSALETSKAQFKIQYDSYAELIETGDTDGAALLETARSAYHDHYLPLLDRFIETVRSGDNAGAKSLMADMRTHLNATIAALENVVEHSEGIAVDTEATGDQIMGVIPILFIVFIIVYTVVTVLIGRKLTAVIAFPTKDLAASAKKIAVGDVDVELNYESGDEIGTLYREFREMAAAIREQVEALDVIADGDYTVTVPVRSEKDVMNRAINRLVDSGSRMIADIRDSVAQVSGGASQIADGAQNLASGASKQAATIEQFTAAINEVRTQAEENNRISGEVLGETVKAGRLMDQGLASMNRMIEAMQGIDESSRDIAKVIKVIDDIAFKTNILALNAAVEAAHAGAHGKGFAVVAGEVRNLAGKSAEAARETSALIESSVQSVTRGSAIVRETGENLDQIGRIAAANAEQMRQLSEASGRQNQSIAEITQGISQLSDVIQGNAATAEQSAASAEEISAQSVALTQIVARFHLPQQSGPEPAFIQQPRMSNGFSLSGSGDASGIF